MVEIQKNKMNILRIIEEKELRPSEVDVVIYHNACHDGTGSAYAIWKYNKMNGNKEIEYYPLSYNSRIPEIKGKNVLMCDISFNKKTMLELIGNNKKFLVIDHHITAKKELREIDGRYKIFDMKHSAAYLTWKYCFPNKSVPLLIEYIQDRDLWKNELKDVNAFASWFYTLSHDFEVYDEYSNDEKLKSSIEKKGYCYNEINKHYIDQLCKYAKTKFVEINNKYYFVATVNSTLLKSDVGARLLEDYPLIDFSLVYSINDWTNSTNFSLRSTCKHVDVSSIANNLRGGGHRNASGVLIKKITNTLDNKKVHKNDNLYEQLKEIYFDESYFEGIKLNIVYMKSSYAKNKLAKYLLQPKYYNIDGTPIQECMAIKKVIKNNQCPEIDYTDLSIVWSNDNNIIEMSIHIDENINDELKNKLIGLCNGNTKNVRMNRHLKNIIKNNLSIA